MSMHSSTTSPRTRRRTSAALLALALLGGAAACTKTDTPVQTSSASSTTAAPGTSSTTAKTTTTTSGDDSGNGDDTTTTAKTKKTTTTSDGSSSGNSDATAIAKKALITEADLPKGDWQASKSSSKKDASFDNDVCNAISPDIDKLNSPAGKAKESFDSKMSGVQNNVDIFDSEDQAKLVDTLVKSDKFAECYQAVLEKSAADDPSATMSDVSVKSLDTSGSGVDADVFGLLEVHLTLKTQGQTIDYAARIFIVRVGRGDTAVIQTEIGTDGAKADLEANDMEKTVKAAVAALKAALAS